ncbi:MAG: SGNH/GDSL hydrolase family protein [Christensenellales bacterium]|jgi:acyl-CoA thioesterase-1
MKPKSISIWGDSIGKSVMFDEARNRHIICRDNYEAYMRGRGLDVRNYARIGLTAPGGMELMTEERMEAGGIAVIEFGGNDSDIDWASVSEHPDRELHPAKVSIPDFKKALSGMIDRARASGMAPIIVTPLPLVADRYFEWVSRGLDRANILKYLGAAEFIYRWQERYDIAVREVAAMARTQLFDLRTRFLGEKNLDALMSVDGIHPNAQGHALIKDAVREFAAGWA